MEEPRSTKQKDAGRRTVLFFVLGCLTTLGVILLILFFTGRLQKEAPEQAQTPLRFMEYEDSFANFDVIDSKGNTVAFPTVENDYAVVISLSMGCKSCLEDLPSVRAFIDILNGSFADVILLWQEEKPWDLIKSGKLDEKINYSCKSALLANGVPHFFLLDRNATVLFSCEKLDELLQKLLSLDGIEPEALQAAADQYLLAHFGPQLEGSEKPLMIEFSMVGCKDCAAAEPIVQGTAVQQAFQTLTVYCDTANIPDEGRDAVDHGNVLAQIYGIRWYPSFVILGENGRIILGETPINALEQNLLDTLKYAEE